MDRFVVGTGRCGSTLLSEMLGEQPDLLSVFELFTGLTGGDRFGAEPISGDALAALISQEQPMVTMVISRGYTVPEITYPYDRPKARYRRADPVPWLLISALPRMSEDPDALFDETLAFVRSLPQQSLSQHYRALFQWWARRLGRRMWLERSGSSIDYLGDLHRCFPDARFVHIHRDGREAALSMRQHHAFRLAISLLYDAPVDADATGDDEIARRLASRPPAEIFGRYWNDQVERGMAALRRIDPRQSLEIRFEDLVRAPREVLGTIAAFFELPAGEWIERAAGRVRGIPPTRFDTLSAAERERLAAACAPGMRLLRRADG